MKAYTRKALQKSPVLNHSGSASGRKEKQFITDRGQLLCRKNVEFYEDKGLDVRFRGRLADFRDSGYDRGHMVIIFMPPLHSIKAP